MKIHGTLEDWSVENGPGYSHIIGRIFGDTKGRFPDGHQIITSSVNPLMAKHIVEGDVVRTRNSIYLLGAPAEEWGNPDEV